MKPVKMRIVNIGILGDVTIPFNTPIIKLFGEIRNGKTTILNAVRWVTGSPIPKDIIKHGEREASIRIDYEGSSEGETYIERSFYLNASGEMKTRAIQFIRNGAAVVKPSDKLKGMAEGFVADQDTFNKLSAEEKRKYFVASLGLDTTEEDALLDKIIAEGKALRKEIKEVGSLEDLEVVAEPDSVNSLLEQRAEITAQNEEANKQYITLVRGRQQVIAAKASVVATRAAKVARLEALRGEAARIKSEGLALKEELANENEEELPDEVAEPEQVSTTDLDKQISDNGAKQEEYRAYQRLLSIKEETDVKKSRLADLLAQKKKVVHEKGEKLVSLNAKHGIEGLIFGGDGSITYREASLDLLSTSEQFELSYELASKQANELGIIPIDRAESLGKSIDDYVAHAKAQGFTVLASIVGEYPANSPVEQGVFVVENGTVTPVSEVINIEEKEQPVAKKDPKPKKTRKVKEKAKPIIKPEVSIPVEVDDVDIEKVNIPEFVKTIAKDRPALTSMVMLAYTGSVTSGIALFKFAPVHEFQCSEMNKPKNVQFLNGRLSDFLGSKVTVVGSVEDITVEEADEIYKEENKPEEVKKPSTGDSFDFEDAEW